MGQKILLRLRPHFDPDAFIPEEDVMHTMLHEVTFPLRWVIPLALLTHMSSIPVDTQRARPP
jgi:hypothetical protein